MATGPIPQVSVTETAARPAGAPLIDVREADEWAEGHVGDAVHIPLSSIALTDIPEGRPVYVICRSGNRSSRVCDALMANDVECVNVEGGMIAWEEAGLPVVR